MVDDQNPKVNFNPNNNASAKPKLNAGIWLLVAVVVIIGLIIWLVNLEKNKHHLAQAPVVKSTATQNPVQQEYSSQASAATELQNSIYAVSKGEKIQFPQVSQGNAITVSALPADLSGLVLTNAANVQIQSVQYANGKTGYKISFSVSGTSRSVYTALNNVLISWQEVSASIANLAAMLEKQDSKYQLQALLQVQGTNTAVVIQIIQK